MKKLSKSAADKKSIKQLKAELWRLCSKYVRERDKHICYTCGSIGNESGHYYHSKGFLIHYDERAVHCQCPKCNRWLSGNLQEYARRLVKDYGPEILDEFNRLRHADFKPSRQDYEDKILYYRLLLDELILRDTCI